MTTTTRIWALLDAEPTAHQLAIDAFKTIERLRVHCEGVLAERFPVDSFVEAFGLHIKQIESDPKNGARTVGVVDLARVRAERTGAPRYITDPETGNVSLNVQPERLDRLATQLSATPNVPLTRSEVYTRAFERGITELEKELE
jgi:hypothetical protein